MLCPDLPTLRPRNELARLSQSRQAIPASPHSEAEREARAVAAGCGNGVFFQ
jgi:hypothetical protein